MSSIELPVERVATAIVDGCVHVHRTLGPGLLESVYQLCLAQELRDRGLKVERELSYPVSYSSIVIATGFRIDMLIEDLVVVENKAVQTILPVHQAQLLTYLKLTGRRVGFLINWNVPVIKEGIRRMVHQL